MENNYHRSNIRIIYVPNRFEKAGREVQEFPYVEGKKLSTYVEQSGYNSEDHNFIVSGKTAEDHKITLKPGDEVIITPKLRIAAAAAFIWAAFTTYLPTTLFVLSLAYSIYSAVTAKRRTPSFGGTGSGMDEDSPTYGWNGIQNTYDVGMVIPVIYGRHRVGGHVLNQYIRSDGDKQYLNMLLAVSQGPINSMSSIEINKNPIENFVGVTATTDRLGTANDTLLPRFHQSHNLYSQTANLLYEQSYVYTTVDDDITDIELKFLIPSGIYSTDADSGAIKSWSFRYRVEYRVHATGSYSLHGRTTIDGKTRSDLYRIYRLENLSANKYDIRITRETENSQLDPVKQGDLRLIFVDEITRDEPLTYPYLAKYAIEALATDQLSGSQVSTTVLVEGRLVNIPAVRYNGAAIDWEDYYYDPSSEIFRRFSDDAACTWDGVTYEDKWSANPVWCIRDMIRHNEYGLGRFIEANDEDLDEMEEYAFYCEEKVSDGDGGYEKRYRLDVVIDSLTRALDMLTQLSSCFNGFVASSTGYVRVIVDKPREVVQMFGMGNIIEGSYQQTWKSIREKFNEVEVSFIDKDKNYERETITIRDETALANADPPRTQTMRIFTTYTSQALRMGKAALLVAQKINKVVDIKVGMDAVACQPGDLIGISHDVPQIGFSGTVKADASNSTTYVKLDQTITVVTGLTYVLRVRFAENDKQEERTVSLSPGDYDYITVSSPFNYTPQANDIYAFGQSGVNIKKYTLTSVKRTSNDDIILSMMEYDADIYDNTDISLPDSAYSALETDVPTVESLRLTEGTALYPDGTVKSSIDVWFTQPDSSNYLNKPYAYKIYLSDDGWNSKEIVATVEGSHYEIKTDLIKGRTYYVRVVSVCTNNMESAFTNSPSSSITIAGKATAPDDVASFTYEWDDTLALHWSPVLNNDVKGYEVRTEDANWGSNDEHRTFYGTLTSKVILTNARGPHTFYVKAFNTSGIYSTNATSVTAYNAPPNAPVVTTTGWFGFQILEWEDVNDKDLAYYEVWRSATNAWFGEEVLLKKVSGTQAEVTGNSPVDVTAASPDSTSITDANLIGSGNNYFVGDRLIQTTGTCADQEATIIAFDTTTGKVTVASWPSGTPDADDLFVIKDRAHYRVRGVDRFGAGDYSNTLTIEFTQLAENELGDEAVTARKVTTGELITLSAQIKDAIITNAKIYSLDAAKIVANTITADKYNELRNTYVYNSEDSLDASYPFEVPFKIVSELLTVQSVKLSFKILNFRAYSTGAASGGTTTTAAGGGETTPAGGGSTSGSEGGAHQHTITLSNSTSGDTVYVSDDGKIFSSGGATITTNTVDGHSHTFTIGGSGSGTNRVAYYGGILKSEDRSFVWESSVANGHNHKISLAMFTVFGTDNVQVYESSNTIRCSGGGTIYTDTGNTEHTHSTPNHQHTTSDHQHSISNHTHSLSFGIYEDSQSPTITYQIDNGSGYGGASAGYTSDQTDLDITSSISGAGWKSLKFNTTARCRVAVIVEIKLDISA